MNRLNIWGVTLVAIVLLLGAGSLAARTHQTLVPNQVSSVVTVPSAASTALLVWDGAIYTDGDDGYMNHDHDKDGDREGDKDDHDHDHDHDRDHHRDRDHDPTPEPSTLLSFGVAILIGGGVLLSRRLRKSK